MEVFYKCIEVVKLMYLRVGFRGVFCALLLIRYVTLDQLLSFFGLQPSHREENDASSERCCKAKSR